MSGRPVVAVALWLLTAAVCASACSKPPRDPLTIEKGRLIVENQTDEDWTNVRISVNRYFHGGAPSLTKRGRMDVRLGDLVSGYGQKFDFGRMQIKDLRLTATRPNGESLELRKDLRGATLDDVFGGKD
jgi:hypothetical protein